MNVMKEDRAAARFVKTRLVHMCVVAGRVLRWCPINEHAEVGHLQIMLPAVAYLNSEMTVANGNVGRDLQRLTQKSIPGYESPGDHVNTEQVARVSGRSLLSECLGEVHCLNGWAKFNVWVCGWSLPVWVASHADSLRARHAFLRGEKRVTSLRTSA